MIYIDPNQLAQMQQGQPATPPQAPQQDGGQGGQAGLSEIHQVYEKLREVLMNLHAQGIPGMDKVLETLNAQHVDQLAVPQPTGGKMPPRMPGQ